MTRQFLTFVVVGGVAAIVNILSRVVFSLVTSFEVAIVLAFFCGLITGFMLNRIFVFKALGAGKLSRQGFRFALVNVVALAQVYIIGVMLARFVFPKLGFLWHAELVAHTIGVCSPIVTSFYAHKYFSFAAS